MKEIYTTLIWRAVGFISICVILTLLYALEWTDFAKDPMVHRGLVIVIGIAAVLMGVYIEYLKILIEKKEEALRNVKRESSKSELQSTAI